MVPVKSVEPVAAPPEPAAKEGKSKPGQHREYALAGARMQTPAAPASRAGSKTHTLPRTSLSRINGLAAQFVSEPEMILAYLEPLPPTRPSSRLSALPRQTRPCRRGRTTRTCGTTSPLTPPSGPTTCPTRRLVGACATRLNPQFKAALILAGRICLQQERTCSRLTNLQQALAAGELPRCLRPARRCLASTRRLGSGGQGLSPGGV